MGDGGRYGKRKKQERPKSPRERTYESSAKQTTTTTAQSNYEVDKYVRKGSKQKGLDTALITTDKKKWERDRGKKKKRGE